MMQRFEVALLLCLTLQYSCYGLPVACMLEYDKGGAAVVYGSPERPQWVLSPSASLQNQTLKCQFGILQGRRNYQEDALACNLDFKLSLLGKNGLEEITVGIVAIFDGHGGREASEMASKLLFDYFYLHVLFQSYRIMAQHYNGDGMLVLSSSEYESLWKEILKEALSKTICDIDLVFSQEAIRNNFLSGSTATVVLLYNGQILVANAGDSKALLVSEKIQSAIRTGALTDDHNPDRDDERARIEAAGGSVAVWGVPRVNGVLAVSRSIGDVYLKSYGVIAEPEYTGWRPVTASNTHLVVASDGIFESLTQKDISDLILEWNLLLLGSQDSNMSFSCPSSTSLAECIVNTAYDKGSHDNLSAIVVPLKAASFSNDFEDVRKNEL